MATTPKPESRTITTDAVRPATDEFAATYAAFSAGLRVEHLPDAVAEAARVNLLDTLACAIAGRTAQGVAEVAALAIEWGGAPQALVWGSRARVPAHHAAWVNGMMAHARDYDDTHDAAVLHAGVSVVPAALAAAELNPAATGADLLAGVAAGLELVCRLGLATTVGIIESGFIYTSLFGYFGAIGGGRPRAWASTRRTTTVNALGHRLQPGRRHASGDPGRGADQADAARPCRQGRASCRCS